MNYAPSLDIYTRPGNQVVYTDENGYDYQREIAREKGLVKGEVYTLARIEIGSCSSRVFLREFESDFNSVMFCSVKDWVRYSEGPSKEDLLFDKIVSALEHVENGDPLKDFLDDDEIIEGLKLLTKHYEYDHDE